MLAIGIDLGTTNSVAAIQDQNGEVRILSTIPSVVSSSREGSVLIGQMARNNAVAAPENTIFSIKRLMGHNFDDEEVQRVRDHYPYAIVSADDPNDRGVRVLFNGSKYAPETISGMILGHIVEDASQRLSEPVTHAVITVPAYFSEIQREATRKAGVAAGLTVKRVIDEPTAAAIAFGINRADEAHHLLVFDMGGGTLDISIGYMADRQFIGESIKGDMWLGGDDFDRQIMNMMVEWSGQTYPGVDPSMDKKFKIVARHHAEQAKCWLSEHERYDIVIPAIVPLPGGQAGDILMTIFRPEFEARIRQYMKKSITLIQDALAAKELTPEAISTVLLVGGATYIPLVRQELGAFFGSQKLRYDVNPMEAVARGAAILATQLEGLECPSCKNINPYEAKECVKCGASLSTAQETGSVGLYERTERDLGIGAVHRGDPDVFSVLIEAGTYYPLTEPKSKRYSTTDRKITIPVYAGDKLKTKASDNQYLGSIEYELPADVPVKTPVTVEFNYDRNRILNVRIKVDGRSELNHEASPKRYGLAPGKANPDQWRTSLQNSINSMDMIMKNYGEFIDAEQRQPLTELLDRSRQVLRGQDHTAGQQALHDLSQAFIGNLGIAGHLFLVDRLLTQVDPRTTEWLAAQTKKLCDAARLQDQDQINLVRGALELEIKRIIETMPVSRELQGYRGLLEIIPEAKESQTS